MRKYKEEIMGCLKVISIIAVLGLAEPIATLLIR